MRKLRVACHVHSEWSYHATWPLRSIADAFAVRGYGAVLMSDHDRGFDERRWGEYQAACEAASDERIRLIPGIEYEDPENVVHVTVWGEGVRFLGSGRKTVDVLHAAKAEGAIAVFAHPWRKDAVARYRPEWHELLVGVEVWNRQYDGIAPNRRAMRFAEKERLLPFASLDFHTRRQLFPLAMTLEAETAPTTASLIEAIASRRVRPEMLGFDAADLADGFPAATLGAVEGVRRLARGPIRRLAAVLNASSIDGA